MFFGDGTSTRTASRRKPSFPQIEVSWGGKRGAPELRAGGSLAERQGLLEQIKRIVIVQNLSFSMNPDQPHSNPRNHTQKRSPHAQKPEQQSYINQELHEKLLRGSPFEEQE